MSPYMFTGLELAPKTFELLIGTIDPGSWDVSRIPERFTPREVIAHLAEWEPIMRGRVQIAIHNPGSTVPVYDELKMAIDSRYAESDLTEQLHIFALERASTVQYLRSIDPRQMQSFALHPERGAQTAEDFANTFLGHDIYHIEQLAGYPKQA